MTESAAGPCCRPARKMPFCQFRNGTRPPSNVNPASNPPRSGRSSPNRERRRSSALKQPTRRKSSRSAAFTSQSCRAFQHLATGPLNSAITPRRWRASAGERGPIAAQRAAGVARAIQWREARGRTSPTGAESPSHPRRQSSASFGASTHPQCPSRRESSRVTTSLRRPAPPPRPRRAAARRSRRPRPRGRLPRHGPRTARSRPGARPVVHPRRARAGAAR